MQWFQNRQIWQNFQNKRQMSEPALHTPDVQDPQNKQPMPEQQPFDTPDEQDPQNKLPVPEPAPHTSAKRQCVSQGCSAGRDAHCPMQMYGGADKTHRRGTPRPTPPPQPPTPNLPALAVRHERLGETGVGWQSDAELGVEEEGEGIPA